MFYSAHVVYRPSTATLTAWTNPYKTILTAYISLAREFTFFFFSYARSRSVVYLRFIENTRKNKYFLTTNYTNYMRRKYSFKLPLNHIDYITLCNVRYSWFDGRLRWNTFCFWKGNVKINKCKVSFKRHQF